MIVDQKDYKPMGVSECIQNLALTDDEHGRLKGRMKAWDQKLKVCEGRMFLQEKEGSVEHRKAKAKTSDEYEKLLGEFESESVEFHILDSQRNTWNTIIEVYRTQQANKRMGNIT